MIFITEYFVNGVSFNGTIEADSLAEAEANAVGQVVLGVKVGEVSANDLTIANVVSMN